MLKIHSLYHAMLSLAILACTQSLVESVRHELKIGVLIEKNSNLTTVLHAAVDLAVEKINNDPLAANHLRLDYQIGSMASCTGQQAIGEFAKLKYTANVDAIIGPSCNEGCLTAGFLATYHSVPMLSHGCSTSTLSDKAKYPTFGRLRAYASASPKITTKALGRFLESMNWKRIGIVHANLDTWSAASTTIKIDLENQYHIHIPFYKDFIEGHRTSSAEANILAIKRSTVRIVLLLVDGQHTMRLAAAAKKHGLYNGKYVFISLDLHTWDLKGLSTPSWYKKDLVEGWFDISPRSLSAVGTNTANDLKKIFLADLQMKLLQAPFWVQMKREDINHNAFYIYDAVRAYAVALKEVLRSKYQDHVISTLYDKIMKNYTGVLSSLNITNFTKTDVQNGIWPGNHTNFTELRNVTLPLINFTILNSTYNESLVVRNGLFIAEKMFALDFAGVSGRVKMNQYGDRVPHLVIRNFINVKHPTDSQEVVASFDGTTNNYVTVKTKYHFLGNLQKPPPDRETCGFMDDKCPDGSVKSSTVLIAIFVPLAAVIVLAVAYRKYKQRKYENDIFNNKRSFLKYSDLIIQRSTIEVDEKSNHSFDDLGSLKNDSLADKDGSTASASDHKNGIVALFKHENVFVKKLKKTSVQLDRDTLLEIKLARDIHSSNVNPYLGVIVEPPRICLVSPYCSKGSLRDVLANEDISLDWVFRISFAADIAAGMAEIHDGIGAMGNLTSFNVLVDRRWTCRISDYGLDKFKEPSSQYKLTLTDEEKYKKLLWTAPELLSLTVNKKSKPGDVYGFGIILSEIITKTMPYENYGYPAKDLVHFVQRRCLPPFRPHVRLQSGLDGRILDLMRRCWHEFAAERPTFADIRKLLKNVMKDKNENQNLVDNMLAMMEKYTNHLERRVKERTEQLSKEKEKVESLLYTMLPKTIAQQLKLGQVIVPETFYCVSALLTDIVDFSAITTTSHPLQVIDLLNDMNKCFDSIIDRFDVFKVENYNEKYSVVSGCPKKNGIRHVRNIAMLSLKLMAKMCDFKIRHKPFMTLRLRICCHCGPVVGGIVGMTTPRYCVYGETMQYVSHLEATGPPLRIQISPEFKEKLNEVGGFETMIRGPVRVKGRGLIVAHFLTGKEGMDITLPEPEQDKGLELKNIGGGGGARKTSSNTPDKENRKTSK